VTFLSHSRTIPSNPKMAKAQVPRALRPFAEENGMASPSGGFVSLEIGSA